MKKIIILLSLLILLPLTATSKPLIPIMKTLFTDVTGTVPDAEEIAHKAELFRQQTGVAPFIVVLPDINNEASLRQNGKAMLASPIAAPMRHKSHQSQPACPYPDAA